MEGSGRPTTPIHQANHPSCLASLKEPSSELTEPSSEPHRPPDHVDHVPSGSTELRPPDHVSSGSAELRPPRPLDHVAMMIATKNGAMTTATTITTGRKAQGPDNFIATD